MYYFFVAKYLAENIADENAVITKIIGNLQTDKNAYILNFIFYHTKNNNLLNLVMDSSLSFFSNNEPATLSKKEVGLDKDVKLILSEVFPNKESPEKLRLELLGDKDNQEQFEEDMEPEEEIEINSGDELRRAIRTVEVIGCIIRNREGSLEISMLKNLFMKAINVNLRLISILFETMKNEHERKDLIDYIKNNLEGEGKIKLSEIEQKEIAKSIVVNLEYIFVCGIIYKTIRSLGHHKLIEITNIVCDELNTPASFLIKHGILIEYIGYLDMVELKRGLRRDDYSVIAKETLKFLLVNHHSLNVVKNRDREWQKIRSLFVWEPIPEHIPNVLPQK